MQNGEMMGAQDDISINDVIDFSRQNIKLIAITAAVVFMSSVAYWQQAPRKYEATFVLQMAQTSPKGGNIEAPTLLAARLRYSATYDKTTVSACGITEPYTLGEYLAGMVKVNAPKAIENVLEIKIHANAPELAKVCAESMVQMVAEQQQALLTERYKGKREQLASYQESLTGEIQELAALRKPDLVNFAYLAKLDKMSWLRTRIDQMQEELLFAHQQPTRLFVPVELTPHPVSPKGKLILTLGLLAGLALGVMLALSKVVWRKFAV